VKLLWLPTAMEDRVAIFDYIEKDSPEAAIIVDDRILNAIEYLIRYPGIGRPGRRKGTKELVIRRTSYVAAYRVKADTVEIVRIVHTSKRWPSLKTKR